MSRSALMASSPDTCNRWYDKHTLIISPGGNLAFNFEHSFSDGAAWNHMLAETYKNLHGTTHEMGSNPAAMGASSSSPAVDPVSSSSDSAVDLSEENAPQML